MKKRTATLTRQELEIMKVVWEHGRVSVRDVYEDLLLTRKVAYTTVMTMMKILAEKGFLKKDVEERAFMYSPAQSRKRVIGAMVQDFVDRVFNGAAQPLLVHLAEDRKISEKDLRELRGLIERGAGK
jgi:BlaI family transcriptional regulator, penicillinase repressor